MQNRLATMIIATLLALSGPAHADTTIDTITAWQISAEPSLSAGWDRIGQTFTVPTTDTTLSTWTVGLQSPFGSDYKLSISAWDGVANEPTGPTLFDSGWLPATGSLQFIDHYVGLTLPAGGSFVAIIDWAIGAPGQQGNVAFFSSASTQGGYPAGFCSFGVYDPPPGFPWQGDHLTDFETGFAATFVPVNPWVDLGQALAGTGGPAMLIGTGPLVAGSPTTLALLGALPGAQSFLVVGFSAINAPFKGGVLVPDADIILALPVDGSGQIVLPFNWPAGFPGGATLSYQSWIQDPNGPVQFAASNGLAGTTP
jgi:hypothetical protein